MTKKYLTGRVERTPQTDLTTDRYEYLGLEQAEPNLGDPLVGPSSITAKPVPPGQQYIMVTTGVPGERYWIPNQGGIIPGTISVFNENTSGPAPEGLVGGLSSTTQLVFIGNAINAIGFLNYDGSNAPNVNITVSPPGNDGEVLFKDLGDFATSQKLVFNSSVGILTIGNGLNVGSGGTIFTIKPTGLIGIGTTDPTQELHIQGDLRLTGTVYDYVNNPGNTSDVLVKNLFGGLTWVNQRTIRAGAGGTYTNIQFHNNAGLVDGASNFVFDDFTNRIGIGSTQPKVLLDVLGISSFKGGTTIDNLNVTGFTTTSTLAVSGTSTTRNLLVTGIATITNVNIDAGEIDVTRIETQNLKATGITTVGFVTGTSAFFTGIVTATKFVGGVDVSQLYVTGISTFLQKVNINSDLGVTGLTTTQNLQVYQSTTLNRLNVSGIGTFSSQLNVNNLNVTGVGTFDNIKIDSNTISTNDGNLTLDSSGGTTQIIDAVFVNDATESNDKDQGSIVTNGGVGIEKNLNVGGQLNVGGATTLASAGGITTTGGDLYVKGDLYVSDDIFYDELFARNGYFTGITSTKDLNVTGIATIATLGVTGLTTTRNLKVIGISTFDDYIDANGGAYIDNIQIGITGNNEIDTSTGNLIIDSAGGTVEITDQLTVSGITTISNTTDSTNKDTGALIVEGGVGIEKNLNVGGNVTLGDANTDTISVNGSINTNVIPTGTRNLGNSSNRWDNVYANTFDGKFVGIADKSDLIKTIKNETPATFYPTFVDSNNSSADYESLYTDAGISYNPSTDLLTLTNLTVSGTSTFNGNTTLGDATSDTVTYNSRVGSGITPSSNNTYDLGSTDLRWKKVWATEFDGRVIGTADKSDLIKTVVTATNASFYPTFVDSNNSSADYESLYTDAGISYNPSTDLLTVGKIKPTQILDSSSGTGTNNYVLTANGSGGWSWQVASTAAGNAAISGIIIKEQSTIVGSGITSIAFDGDGVTATATGNDATITFQQQVGPTGPPSTVPGPPGPPGSGTAAGSNTEVQYNSGGNFAANSNLVFDGTNLSCGGNITAYYSDERLKENITTIPSALTKLLTLRGVTFNSNKLAEQYGYIDKKEQVGVIAQDIEKVLPQIVVPAPFDVLTDKDGNKYSKSGENYKTVDYPKLIPLLIEAIKEQREIIVDLQNRLEILEGN